MRLGLPHTPRLESPRFTLLSPAAEGFDVHAAYLAEGAPRFAEGEPDDEAMWWSMATILGHWQLNGYGHFAVIDRATGENYGLVGPWFPRGWPEPELSFNLLEGAEGKGIAYEAGQCVLDWLFGTLGWDTCASMVDEGNTRSIALMERLGASPEGTFTHDTAGSFRIWRHSPKPAGKLN